MNRARVTTAATALGATAAMLLTPASPSAAASHARQAATAASSSCSASTYAALTPSGDMSNPPRTEGGHFWWRNAGTDVCIGTLRIWVHYRARATKTWRGYAYFGNPSNGDKVPIASRTFTLNPGWYFWDFPLHRLFNEGLSLVCAGASHTAGIACSQPFDTLGPRRAGRASRPASSDAPGARQA